MPFNMGQIFPISDVPSARLMKLKALCLSRAGIITDVQRDSVIRRANHVLSGTRFARAQRPPYSSRAA